MALICCPSEPERTRLSLAREKNLMMAYKEPLLCVPFDFFVQSFQSLGRLTYMKDYPNVLKYWNT